MQASTHLGEADAPAGRGGWGHPFTYTPTGQRATATDARGTTSYAYDSRNRLARTTYPDGRTLAYAYDAHGNRTKLSATIGSTSLTRIIHTAAG